MHSTRRLKRTDKLHACGCIHCSHNCSLLLIAHCIPPSCTQGCCLTASHLLERSPAHSYASSPPPLPFLLAQSEANIVRLLASLSATNVITEDQMTKVRTGAAVAAAACTFALPSWPVP